MIKEVPFFGGDGFLRSAFASLAKHGYIHPSVRFIYPYWLKSEADGGSIGGVQCSRSCSGGEIKQI
jgi:hypothetical protein